MILGEIRIDSMSSIEALRCKSMFLGGDVRIKLSSWIMRQGLDESKLDTLVVEGGVDTTSIALKAKMLGLEVIEETLEETKQSITYIISSNMLQMLCKDTIRFEGDNACRFSRLPFKEIKFINVDTSKLTVADYMFCNNRRLERLDISCFDLSSVESMNWMFVSPNLKELTIDTNKFRLNKQASLKQAFSATEIEKLDLSNFNLGRGCDMSGLFSKMKLKELRIDTLRGDSQTCLRKMFSESCIDKLVIGNLELEAAADIGGLFEDSVIGEIEIHKSSIENVKYTNSLFRGVNIKTNIVNSILKNTISIKCGNDMFSYSYGERIDLSQIEEMEECSRMFMGSEVKEIDLSNLEIDGVELLTRVCSSIEYPDTTCIYNMFKDCTADRIKLRKSTYETLKVLDKAFDIFTNCKSQIIEIED